jgi:hypothetical protein
VHDGARADVADRSHRDDVEEAAGAFEAEPHGLLGGLGGVAVAIRANGCRSAGRHERSSSRSVLSMEGVVCAGRQLGHADPRMFSPGRGPRVFPPGSSSCTPVRPLGQMDAGSDAGSGVGFQGESRPALGPLSPPVDITGRT